MKVPINKDSPLAMDDFDAAVQQRMERLQSYIDLIRTAEAVEEEVKVKGTKLYLGPEDVAAYLNCSIPTARQYMHRPGFSWVRTAPSWLCSPRRSTHTTPENTKLQSTAKKGQTNDEARKGRDSPGGHRLSAGDVGLLPCGG